ncbi:MAG: hypothetical protein E7485_06410 [Ruminococcaceae bacterium]|nr:hypothetical protein [Oscillospiraceae bacterium]
MAKPTYNVKLSESQRDQLIRYLNDQAQYTIKQQHEIKEQAQGDYDANTRTQLEVTTVRLKWFNGILSALQNAKQI